MFRFGMKRIIGYSNAEIKTGVIHHLIVAGALIRGRGRAESDAGVKSDVRRLTDENQQVEKIAEQIEFQINTESHETMIVHILIIRFGDQRYNERGESESSIDRSILTQRMFLGPIVHGEMFRSAK